MPEILTPDCPLRGEAAYMVMGGGTQAFCGSDNCPVLTWDPTHSREEFLRTARQVRITSAREGEQDG